MPSKTTSWYIKTTVITTLLFVQTYLIGYFINLFVIKKDYFNLTANYNSFFGFGITLLFFLLTYSLSIGGWRKYAQYLYISSAIGLGLLLNLLKHDIYNGISVVLVLMVLVSYNIYKATSLKSLLVRFEPRFVLDTSLRGLVVVFSIYSIAVLMLAKTSNTIQDLNVGQQMVQLAKEPIQSLNLLKELNTNVETLLEGQINSMLLPYKSFFKPVIAIFTYVTFLFIGKIIYYIALVLLHPVFYLAKIFKFINIQKSTVEQETPNF